MKKLDDIDLAILAALQRDGRLPNVALAREVGLSATPCAERVRALEAAGIIRGYGADLDPERLDATSALLVELRQKDGEKPNESGMLARIFSALTTPPKSAGHVQAHE